MSDSAQDSRQSPTELHRFWGSMRDRVVVDGVPGVVAEETRFSIAFVLDSCRRELQGWLVTDELVREDNPEAAVNELGHFRAEEVSVFIGGSVATSFDVEVSGLERQGFRRSLCRHPFVSPAAEKFRGRVVDLL